MKLLVAVDGRPGEFQFERSDGEWRFVYAAGSAEPASRSASLIEVEPGVFSILMNGRSYQARVEPVAGGGYQVEVRGRRFATEVKDPRGLTRRNRGGIGEGPLSVAAPMPGKVVRVLVSAGDTVEAGVGLVVVEAMKMQNEMKSPKAGRVVQVTAREGATVAAGDVLATIE
jgi:biotin carboxyl carrier protein